MGSRPSSSSWQGLMNSKISIDHLLLEAKEAQGDFWFVRALTVVERTNATVTVHLSLTPDLWVQLFLSERSGRFSLALVQPGGSKPGK